MLTAFIGIQQTALAGQGTVGNVDAEITTDINVPNVTPNTASSSISVTIRDNNTLYDVNYIIVKIWAAAWGYTENSSDDVLGHYTLRLNESNGEESSSATWTEVTNFNSAFSVTADPDDDTAGSGTFAFTFTPAKVARATEGGQGDWSARLIVYEDEDNNQNEAEDYSTATKGTTDTFDMAGYVEITTSDTTATFTKDNEGTSDVALSTPSDGEIDFNVIANEQWKVQVKASAAALSCASETIQVGNITYDDDTSVAGSTAINTSWANSDITGQDNTGTSGSDKLFGLWIDIPSSQANGTYSGANFEIQAVLTANYSTTDTPATQPAMSLAVSDDPTISTPTIAGGAVGSATWDYVDGSTGKTIYFTITDNDGLSDLTTLVVYIYCSTQGDTDDHTDHYTLTWTESTDAYSGTLADHFSNQVDPGAANSSILGYFWIDFEPSKIATYGTNNWQLDIVATDSYGAVTTYSSGGVIDMASYSEIVYDDATFSWSASPGDSNVTVDAATSGGANTVDFHVISNFDFKVTILGSDFDDGAGHTIDSQTYLYVDDDATLAGSSLMPSSATDMSTGNSASTSETGNALLYTMWLTVPNPCYDGTYTMTTTLAVVAS